jgi:hypothetical protein
MDEIAAFVGPLEGQASVLGSSEHDGLINNVPPFQYLKANDRQMPS